MSTRKLTRASYVNDWWDHGASNKAWTLTIEDVNVPSSFNNNCLFVLINWVTDAADVDQVVMTDGLLFTKVLTKVQDDTQAGGTGICIYKLEQGDMPAGGGNHDIEIDMSTGSRVVAGAILVEDVNLDFPHRDENVNELSAQASSTIDITTNEVDLVIDCVGTKGTGVLVNNTVGSGQIERWNQTKGTAFQPNITASASTEVASAGTSTEMSWTFSPTISNNILHMALPVVGIGLEMCPPEMTLELTPLAYSVDQGVNISPATATLELAPLAYAVDQGANVQPAVASLEIAPNVAGFGVGVLELPSAGSLEISTSAPTVGTGALVAPSSLPLDLGALAYSAGVLVDTQPALGLLELRGLASAVGVGVNISPATAVLELSPHAYTISAPVEVEASTGLLEATSLQATFGVGVDIKPSTAALDLLPEAFSVDQGILVSPTTNALDLLTSAHTVGTGVEILPSLLELRGRIHQPSISQGDGVSPATGRLELRTDGVTAGTGVDVTSGQNSLEIGALGYVVGTGVTIQVDLDDLLIVALPSSVELGDEPIDITPALGRLLLEPHSPTIIAPEEGSVEILARVVDVRARSIEFIVLTGRVFVFQKQRIQNAIVERANAGLFFPARYGKDDRLQIKGDDHEAVQPASVLCNETKTRSDTPRRNRTGGLRERTGWEFLLELGFHEEVTGEVFENDLNANPIRLPRDGDLPGFEAEFLNADYEHPTTSGSSGTRVIMTFNVNEVPA